MPRYCTGTDGFIFHPSNYSSGLQETANDRRSKAGIATNESIGKIVQLRRWAMQDMARDDDRSSTSDVLLSIAFGDGQMKKILAR